MAKNLQVMLVDDSLITLKKLSKILEDLGHKVVCTCKTGKEALYEYPNAMPDLVLMDITMPDMNGIDATQKILEKDGNALIIMVTSHGQEQMVLQAISVGAKGYLLKPVDGVRLQETIDRVWKKFRQ